MDTPTDSSAAAPDPMDGPGDRRDAEKGRTGDRRRHGWRDFRRTYPGFVFTLLVGLASIVALDAWLYMERRSYDAEVARLRASMTDTERAKTDAIIDAEQHKGRIALELARRQAKIEKALHLSIALDSGKLYLEREGAVLRDMAAAFGPEAKVSTGGGTDSIPIVVPRGQRSVAKLNDASITLDGGTLISAANADLLANDSTPIPPGSVRIGRSDMSAIMPNLRLGMRVYFY